MTKPLFSPDSISDALIVGCWQLDDRSWKRLSETEIERIIDIYLAWGITCFDTADIYGRSERLLGKFLKGRDCKVLTKAVFFGEVPTPKQVRQKVYNSLRNLQRDSLDCVQIHWHDPSLDFVPTLEIFAELLEEGKIQHLGVTNFNTEMLKGAIAHAPLEFHQVQYSLIDRRVEKTIQQFCATHQMQLLPYGSLAGGYLSDQFLGAKTPSSEGEHARGFYYSYMIRNHGGWEKLQQFLAAVAPIAKKYDATIAQLALNWVKQQAGVAAVISGLTTNRQQIEENIKALKLAIAPSDLETITQYSTQLFSQLGDVYSYERSTN